MKKKILVVEDEMIVSMDIKNSLKNLGYEVCGTASSGEKAVELALEKKPDLILMDIKLKGAIDGTQAASMISDNIPVAVVYLTSYGDEETVLRSKETGPFGYILKPFDEKELQISIEIALYKHKMETKLKETKEWLAAVLKSIGDAVIITDNDGKILFINQIAQNVTGWKKEEVKGEDLTRVFNIINENSRKPVENPVKRVLKEGIIVGLGNHTILITKDGKEIPIDDSAAPIINDKGKVRGSVLVFRDVTEKRKLEKELLKAEKLESVGILAGGKAHDFNNILTVILGNITLARLELDCNSNPAKKLLEAEKSCMHARDLTQRLLTFAKGGTPVKEATSIHDLINESACFALCGANVNCEVVIPDDILPAFIDPGQLSQVISNLVINASQAMPDGGTITIQAETATVTKNQTLSIIPGKYVKISIKDQGHGIPNKYLSKIFDPYFTTKQTGSGLGLTTAFSIVKNHDGYLFAESEIGKGTTFTIYLPVSEKAADLQKIKAEQPVHGYGKILVMDDEEMVRDVCKETLKSIGYKVDTAKDGNETVLMYKKALEEKEPYNAVILDLTVPGAMGGKETVQELKRIDPDVKAIVSSGYSKESIMADVKKYGFNDIIAKPYNIARLSKVLNKVLGQS